jgi:chaperone modulatory protein CbpM
MSHLFTIREVCETLGVDSGCIHSFVEREWILPASREGAKPESEGASAPAEHYLDDCDLARARFILELRETFGANDESIPIILHLLDQIHSLRERMMQIRPQRYGRA